MDTEEPASDFGTRAAETAELGNAHRAGERELAPGAEPACAQKEGRSTESTFAKF